MLTKSGRAGGGGSGPSEYAGWCFRVCVHVHLLRRESSTRGRGVGLPEGATDEIQNLLSGGLKTGVAVPRAFLNGPRLVVQHRLGQDCAEFPRIAPGPQC